MPSYIYQKTKVYIIRIQLHEIHLKKIVCFWIDKKNSEIVK